MDKSKMLSISIILLALSMVVGSFLIAYSIRSTGLYAGQPKITKEGKVLITLEEASDYVGIPVVDIQSIIKKENEHINQYGSFSGKLPYVKFNDKLYFHKEQLNQWFKEKAHKRTDFIYYPKFE